MKDRRNKQEAEFGAVLPLPAERTDFIPKKQRKTLFELERKHCRWPVGEPHSPDFYFCGKPEAAFPECPYCRKHTFRAYSRPRPKDTTQPRTWPAALKIATAQSESA